MYRSPPRRVVAILVTLLVAISAGSVSGAHAGTPVVGDSPGTTGAGFGPKCAALTTTPKKARCYVKLLLADINASRSPSLELPKLDAETQNAGGFIAGACHALMHVVGREYAREHHLTLGTLQDYLPKSDNPGCSAGFGHGLIMYLGPQIVRVGPKGALRACMRLRTRMRQYSCVHGLGHAYMRVYGEYLRYALPMCHALGPRAAPDCAQGAFHDYWIATGGRDSTRSRPGLVTSPRVLCGVQRPKYVLACWYRVFIERPPGRTVESAADIDALCKGLHDRQRAGCVAAAALTAATSDPFELERLCATLTGADPVNCLRAVPVEEIESVPVQQLTLIRSCQTMPTTARRGCYLWFGKVLTVVTNGRFLPSCRQLRSPSARRECLTGAHRMRDALVTFA